MPTFRLLAVVAGILSVSSVCYGESITLWGTLIYSAGANKIIQLDLSSRKSEVIYDRSRHAVTLPHLTKVSTEEFVFDECPVTTTCVLKSFNVVRKEVTLLREGDMPLYMPKSNTLLFYAFSPQTRERWLFRANLDALEKAQAVHRAPIPIRLGDRLEKPPVGLNDEDIAFVGEDSNLWVYHISKATMEPLQIAHSFPETFIRSTGELICFDRGTKTYFAFNLRNRERKVLPNYEWAFGLFYVPQIDTIIYGISRRQLVFGETYDIYAHNYRNNTDIRLVKGQSISGGIWLPHIPGMREAD